MRYKLTTTIFLLLSTALIAQQGKYFDAPFGGGIGYTPAWYIPNVDPINTELNNIGMKELSTSGLYSSSIGGFIYIGFIKNLRVGGMGFGGSLSQSQQIDETSREVVYNLGGGGVTLEYTLPFIKNFGVSVGAAIGGGSLELELYNNSDPFNWQSTWNEFSDPSNESNFHRTIKNSFWMFSPTINIDYPLYRFVVLRLGIGYQLTFNDDWTANNNQTLNNVPSDLNSNAFFIQSGIFIGFFSF
jgi:hypothetical protein